MKRIFGILILMILILSGMQASAEQNENLLYNGDFSILDAAGMPDGWNREMWLTDKGVSFLGIADGFDGDCVEIVNIDANDARFTQTVSVEPNSLYRFSCDVLASGCGGDGYGANLSFENTYTYSDLLTDTEGEWQRLTVYGKTDADQTQVTLMLRLGGYSHTNTGTAYFDNAEFVQVDEVPQDATALPLYREKKDDSTDENGVPKRNTETHLLMTALYAVAILAVARRRKALEHTPLPEKDLFVILMAEALILRIIISFTNRGYYTDINCFSAWSERIFADGPAHFYAEGRFCDYPPLYMLMLWPVAALRNLFGVAVGSSTHIFLLKSIPILFDLLSGTLVRHHARRKGIAGKYAVLLSALILLNPAAIINSAAWGQIDSVFTLLIVVCAIRASDEDYISALTSFAAAALIKPQALLFAPLGLFAVIVNLIRRPDKKKTINAVIGLGCALALMYLTAFLFCIGTAQSFADALLRPVSWLIGQYSQTLGSYEYLTLNALNLYTLLDLNWAHIDMHPLWTAAAWTLFGFGYVYSCLLYTVSKKKNRLALCGAVLIAMIYAFGPKIHDRYIYPVMLLLLAAYADDRDRRLLIIFTVAACTTALNEYLVLQGGMTAANTGHLQASEQWLNASLSAINILNTLYLGYTALDICRFDHIVPLKEAHEDKGREKKRATDYKLRLTRKDKLLVGAVTAAYAIVAFIGLGATAAPQKGWVSAQAGESVVFDLGKTESWRMLYYGGICNTTFTVELSNDADHWTKPCHAQYDQGQVFRWLYFVPCDEYLKPLHETTQKTIDGSAYLCYADTDNAYPFQKARYVRITAERAGLDLLEFSFRNPEGDLLPVEILDYSVQEALADGNPQQLIDEQHTVPEVPTYYNSTYFDEIYHARTAYELLHGETIYEWTHPPLGKVLMMEGVRLFGMTPFGWRFMGALIGVLMVPLMYLLTRQLTKSGRLSFIAMCLMALDSMHFTQTRIATIDSYAVFWIMLEYFLMFRYVQMDWRKVTLRRSLVTLGLCGVTMGIACATKWIGCYAALGLAILLFMKLNSEMKHVKVHREYNGRLLRTLGFCVVFFVIVPIIIYYFSYFRALRCEGVVHITDMLNTRWIKRVWELQKSMLNYHSGLGNDTHFFRSPWYQWPVIWWPMWYYSGTPRMPEGTIASISCMGNPAVWWTGLIALIFTLLYSAWKRRASSKDVTALIGFSAQYLPWVLVPRSTFIYHYFASVPFIILCTVLMLNHLRRRNEKAFKWASIALPAAALILFVAFYPLESGMPVARSYANHLRWFKWYNF